MNVDTDMQYAFTRAVAGHMFKIYDGDQNIEIRTYVISAFTRRKSERAGAKLLAIAKGSGNVVERKAAINAIARRSGEQSVDIILDLYGHETDQDLKAQMLNSLCGSNDPRVTKLIMQVARNTQTPLDQRRRAIGCLSRSKDPEVLKFLEDLLK